MVAALCALLAAGGPVALTSPKLPVSPARWHLNRRNAILEAHPEVAQLASPESKTLPVLTACNAAQIGLAVATAHLPTAALVPIGVFVGGTLSLWQFALLHDVKHGTAQLPDGVSPNEVLFYGSLPSLFGYYLYLRYGHLSHHKDFGQRPLRDLFNSEQANFEDGDALFVAHRQQMPQDAPHARVGFFGKEQVGGLGLSISRTIYSLLWLDVANSAAKPALDAEADAEAGPAAAIGRYLVPGWNAAVYSFSMSFERAALVFGGGIVPALVGRNYFFPGKPDAFHETCAKYARTSLAIQLALLAVAGPGALVYLFWAEVGWQLPIHPASAMFVSNHPSLDAPEEGSSVNGCQPTASCYIGEWFDWLCCFSNYHTEHHDFPDVPAWRLRELRDIAAPFYSDAAIAGARDGWLETMRRTFAGREFYACSGANPGGIEGEASGPAQSTTIATSRSFVA